MRPGSDGAGDGFRPVLALAALGTLGLIAALAVVRYLPTHDGPQHIFLGHVENHFADAGSIYPRYFSPSGGIAARGFLTIFAPFESFMSWRAAHQVTVGIIVILWSWGALALARAVHPGRAVLGLLGFVTAFQWAVYMGFYSYVLALGVGLCTLALAVGVREWSWKRRAGITALLVVLSLLHIFAAGSVGFVLLLLVVFRASRRELLGELVRLALMGLPTILMAAYVAGLLGMGAKLPSYANGVTWVAWGQRFQQIPDLFASGPWWRAWPPTVLAVVGLGAAVVRWRRGSAAPEEKVLLVASTTFLLLAFFLPLHLREWEFFSPRFIPLGVLCAAVLVPVENLATVGARRWSLAAAGVWLVVSVGWAARHHQRLARACGPALAGLDAPLHFDASRLPIVLDTTCDGLHPGSVFEVPYVEPLFNLGQLYAVQQGGIVPYLFVGIPQKHPFIYTEAARQLLPPAPDKLELWAPLVNMPPDAGQARRRPFLTALAVSAARWHDVIFYGRPADRDVIRDHGFDTVLARGDLWLGRFRNCPLHLDVSGPRPPDQPLHVAYGWRTVKEPIEALVSRPEANADRITLDDMPCEDGWVRVVVDMDRSGGASAGDLVCAGADPDARMLVGALTPGRTLRCELSAP